ncbi:MAG: type II toxin-antitoxin system VapB family antitoxin [Deltaproteobacteria bacterium]|nr:type II toxin-antitoxin system VapB family antitoxin [Deltaproteobacteria bacterium]
MARTVVDINEDVFEKAKALTGLKKKVDIINYALKKLVDQKEIERILELKGKVDWAGDLDKMRADRVDRG